MNQTGQRLDEHVDTLIPVLVTTSREEVQSLVQIKVVVTVKMAAHKVVDALLVGLMQVLELVGSGELFDIETIGKDTIGLALEQML